MRVNGADKSPKCLRCWQKRHVITPATRKIDNFENCEECATEDGYEATDGEPIISKLPEDDTASARVAQERPAAPAEPAPWERTVILAG